MINVGVMGLGMMGLTHLDVYNKRSDVRVVAISDKMPDRLEGKVRVAGNVEGQAQGTIDYASVRKYLEGMDLIRDPDIQLVDICLPTPMHVEYAVAALRAGKHVMVEKPVARTAADAELLMREAAPAQARGQQIMVGMCMRFWPGWTWLKDAIDQKTYGKVLSAHFRRVTNHPGGMFYRDGALCGGALLDLHIHDTDFVQFCFGVPQAVQSFGYKKVTSEWDHIVTHYRYGDVPLVMAEGSWALADGVGFKMQYTVNFEQATAVFELGARDPLTLCAGGKAEAIPVDGRMGYELEIDYFLQCIKEKSPPKIVTMKDAVNCVRILEAEGKSAATGQPVEVRPVQ